VTEGALCFRQDHAEKRPALAKEIADRLARLDQPIPENGALRRAGLEALAHLVKTRDGGLKEEVVLVRKIEVNGALAYVGFAGHLFERDFVKFARTKEPNSSVHDALSFV
jgi:hypothetical protein